MTAPTFLVPIATLLTKPPGNLAYHLVLLFAIGGTLQATWLQWQRASYPQTRRLLQGLSALLAIRFVLFIIGGMAWQHVVTPHLVLPIANRAAIAFTLLLFTWLWGYPEHTRRSDTYLAIGAVVILLGALSSWLVWAPLAERYFNNALPDLAWSVFNILLGLIGIGILLYRRPDQTNIGILALTFIVLGQLAHILWPPAGGDLDGYTRLAALMAHPLLFTLPYRFLPPVATPPPRTIQVQKATIAPPDTAALQALLDLLATSPQDATTCPHLARAVALLMKADLCLILTPPQGQRLSIACGYDLIREQTLTGTTLDASSLPILTTAMQRRRSLRLPASSTSDDVRSLAATLNLQRTGPLLAAPLAANGQSHGSIVLASPYAQHAWSLAEQERLANIAQRLGKWLTVSTPLPEENTSSQETLATLQAQIQDLQQTLEEERSRAATLQERLHTVATAYDQAQRVLEHLKEESRQLPPTPSSDIQEDMDVLLATVQDLRQPLSSLVGYTDLLLSETAGILGALQRQFLERIRASAQRLEKAVNDLAQTLALETEHREAQIQQVDLNEAIDLAISRNGALLREKRLLLRVDLPDRLPEAQLDKEMFHQILHHLIHNAALASPEEGEIQLRLQILDEAQGEEGHLLLLEVQDSGGGIAEEDLPRVFSRRYRAAYRTISGLGDNGLGLPLVKVLVEALQGRIWVESLPEQGTKFSVLLPFPCTASPSNKAEGALA